MSIVIVNWRTDDRNVYIDGRVPMFESPKTTGYWVPHEQADMFAQLALADENVSYVCVYSYKEHFRK